MVKTAAEEKEKEEQEQEEEQETCPFFVHDISVDLKKQFKMTCLANEITMKEGLIEALKMFIEKNG